MKWVLSLTLLLVLSACEKAATDCENTETMPIIAHTAQYPALDLPLPSFHSDPSQFRSCQELGDYAMERLKIIEENRIDAFDNQTCSNPTGTPLNSEIDAIADNQPTNVQETGTDEADRVKVSKNYIFYARENAVEVLDRKTKQSVQSLKSPGYWRPHIYVSNETLVVIRPHEKPFIYNPDNKNQTESSASVSVFLNPQKFDVVFYDLTKKSLSEIKRKTILGHYKTSRLSKEGLLTLITSSQLVNTYSSKEGNLSRINEIFNHIDCTQVSTPIIDDTDTTLTSIHSFDLSKDSVENSKETHLLGKYEHTYMQQNLFLTKTNTHWFWWDGRTAGDRNKNYMTKLSLKNKQWQESARVEFSGHVPSVWSFKEMGDIFYVATTQDKNSSDNQLKVFNNTNDSLHQIHAITGIAPGERLRSVRFTESYAYLVTFRDIDPLFIIDLKNKENPKVISELKIPGYSSYLHKTEHDTLIGVGYGANLSQLQLSLFDVRDPEAPKTLEQIALSGDSSHSSAQHDHHSFFYDEKWKTMAIPTSSHNYGSRWKDVFFETGAHIYSIAKGHFEPIARISHRDWIQQHCKESSKSWGISPGHQDISRVLKIDNQMMSFSDFGVRTHNPKKPSQEFERTLFPRPRDSCPKPIAICQLIE